MVYMLTKLTECKADMVSSNEKVNIMYDICCQLEKHLKVKVSVKVIPLFIIVYFICLFIFEKQPHPLPRLYTH